MKGSVIKFFEPAKLNNNYVKSGNFTLYALELIDMPKKFLIALFIVLVVVIFAVQNADYVTITIFFWEFTVSLSIVIVAGIIFGVLIGSFLTTLSHGRKNRIKLKEAEKRQKGESNP